MKLVRTGVGVTGTGNTGIGVRGTSNNIGVRGDGDGFGVVEERTYSDVPQVLQNSIGF
jgi:hypothetical protein